MKQPIRSFALGLLSAGILLLVMFYFADDSKNKTDNMSTDDMIASVEAEGYQVLTESEYISVSVQSDENDKDKSQSNEDQEESTSKENQKNEAGSDNSNDGEKNNSTSEENSTITYTLTVKSGMAPSTISGILAENNVIQNQDKFTQYMEEEGYTTKVQLGDFELTSDMSHYEIAEELTN